MDITRLIDKFISLVDVFDSQFERIYHLEYDNLGDLVTAIELLYGRYHEIDLKFNEIVDFAKSTDLDGSDVSLDEALQEVTTEYMRITDVKESMYKIIKT